MTIRIEGKLPHIKRPCANCPFKKDTLKGWLGAERMTEILAADSFVCHKKTDMQCAGHMLIKGEENVFVQLAKRLGVKLKLAGREQVFDTEQECVSHHANPGDQLRADYSESEQEVGETPPHNCQFCGAKSWLDPSEQSAPPDYCHESDHGEPDQ